MLISEKKKGRARIGETKTVKESKRKSGTERGLRERNMMRQKEGEMVWLVMVAERVKLAVAYNISCEHSSTGYCRCSIAFSISMCPVAILKQALHVSIEKTYFTALICWLLKF